MKIPSNLITILKITTLKNIKEKSVNILEQQNHHNAMREEKCIMEIMDLASD